MFRQFLLLAGLVVGASAYAASNESMTPVRPQLKAEDAVTWSSANLPIIMAVKNDGQAVNSPVKKVEAPSVHWRRPAGQFWGTGYFPALGGYYPFTPVVLRPWVDYTFENISTGISGTPTWKTNVLTDPMTGAYEIEESTGNEVTARYLRYENCPAPRMSYPNQIPFPTLFYGGNEYQAPYNEIQILADNETSDFYGESMLVAPHFWSLYTRTPSFTDERNPDGVGIVAGAETYPGMQQAPFFGTNNGSNNAMATRFEKPERPYLLNSIHWVYAHPQAIPKNVPLTAYVFKTVKDNSIVTTPSGYELECVELGELIAVSESYVPAARDFGEGTVVFTFTEKNEVTGAESETSLVIEDDITVVVTGYEVDLGNGGWLSTMISLDDIDEGYGNMGFLGNMEVTEDGGIAYTLFALKDYFVEGFGNTTLGILADVTYPWLEKYYEQPDDILLPNEEPADESEQGLVFPFFFQSSSMTDDYEVTFNGEPECDWLQLVDVGDEMEDMEDGTQVFTGQTCLVFQADPNPEDIDRTCVVNVTIPAASYNITIRQGTNNNAVKVVGVEGNTQYFDLQGRRVTNPEKGIYIKKSGNKTSKVIL